MPNEIYELEVEIWPTSIVVPAGYRLGLSIRGNDYQYEGDLGQASLTTFKNRLTGCGPFLHDDPLDRPAAVFGRWVTIHTGPTTGFGAVAGYTSLWTTPGGALTAGGAVDALMASVGVSSTRPGETTSPAIKARSMLAASAPIWRYGTLTAVIGGCIRSRRGMSL